MTTQTDHNSDLLVLEPEAKPDSGTPINTPPPAPPIDGVGGSAANPGDGPKRPKPGSMASEPLDKLLFGWRTLSGLEQHRGADVAIPEEAIQEALLRASIADAIDGYRAAGLGYEAALVALDVARAMLPDAPEPIPAEDALEEAA